MRLKKKETTTSPKSENLSKVLKFKFQETVVPPEEGLKMVGEAVTALLHLTSLMEEFLISKKEWQVLKDE